MPAQMLELFNGGLVTARHPAMLNSGELQRADECIYRVNDPSIEGAPGRSLYNTGGAFSSKVKHLAHLTFDDQTDQLMVYTGTALFRHDFTALTTGTAFTEIGTSGIVFGNVSNSTTFVASTQVVASCTISGTAVSSSAGFSLVVAGMVVSGTGVTAGTTVSSVTDTSNLVLSQAATNGTVTLTFTLYPFLSTVVGTRVFGLDSAGTAVPQATVVTAVSAQNGTTGHYNTITISAVGPFANTGNATLTFEFGLIGALPNVGTETLDIVNVADTYFTGVPGGVPQRVSWRTPKNGDAPVVAMRPMGMNPVAGPIQAATTAGAWNASTTFGAGYYWFLATEVYCPTSTIQEAERSDTLVNEIIESIYLGSTSDPNNPNSNPADNRGRPIVVNITDPVTQGVLITFPAVTNTGVDGRVATHWNIYMAGPTPDARSQPSNADFRRIRSVPISTYAAGATYTITEPSVAAQRVHATANAAGKDGGGTTRSNFLNPTNAQGERDGVYATATSGSGVPNPRCIALSAWKDTSGTSINTGGSYATASIVGIQVDVWATGGNGKSGCFVHVDTASKHGVVSDLLVFGVPGVITVGGPSDTLGAAWVTSDLSSIAVTVAKAGSNSNQTLYLDAVILTVYFTGGTVNLDGPPYRVVTYRSQIGTTVSDPSSLPPQNYTTGTVFQGMFVTNDPNVPALLHYSLPNYPEYFPKPYTMKLLTRRKDIVTFMRPVGQVLVVGMRDNIRRVNYLPTESDTTFGIDGVAQEPLCEDHGIPGKQAGVLFDMPGAGSILFYVSTAGPRLTDGITDRPANTDLDWRNTVNLDFLANAQVRVYTREQWIVVYYSPSGTSHGLNTKALVFHYAADKIKDGELPCTGPITVSGRATAEANLSGTPLLLSANENDFNIYVEDQGFAVPSSATVANSSGTPTVVQNCPLVRTRRGFLAGQASLAREERVYALHTKAGASITAVGTTVAASTTVSGSATFGSVVKGMRVRGTGIKPGTIVTLVTSSSSITLSQAALTAGTATLTFDTGTFSITVRGANIDEDITALDTSYTSTLTGDLVVVHNDNAKQALEYQFEKVLMPDASHADLGVLFKLHSMTALASDLGLEQNRSAGG
jgi:hypothetical protein